MLNFTPSEIISRLLILLIALPVHEFAHAWTADRFGDDTPRLNGRLTLNPLAHLDLLGSLMLLVGVFGWAKPVPVNPYALGRRSPSAGMWVALAGPLSNFMLAILAAVPLRLGVVPFTYSPNSLIPSGYQILTDFVFINLALMLFNLIPLAPLDGEKVAQYYLPSRWARGLDAIRPYSPLLLMAIIFILPWFGINLLGWIIGPPLQALNNLLIGVSL